jgi:3-deoxy-D-manno-octulosonic-acid transferase
VIKPHTYNFAKAAELALTTDAAQRVPDIATSIAAACGLLATPDRCDEAALLAQRFAAQHQGAARRMAARIVASMPPPS